MAFLTYPRWVDQDLGSRPIPCPIVLRSAPVVRLSSDIGWLWLRLRIMLARSFAILNNLAIFSRLALQAAHDTYIPSLSEFPCPGYELTSLNSCLIDTSRRLTPAPGANDPDIVGIRPDMPGLKANGHQFRPRLTTNHDSQRMGGVGSPPKSFCTLHIYMRCTWYASRSR